jgi:hypothetical protein
MLQVVASPMIIILTTLEVSFTLIENIYSTGITHDDRKIFIVQATEVTVTTTKAFHEVGTWLGATLTVGGGGPRLTFCLLSAPLRRRSLPARVMSWMRIRSSSDLFSKSTRKISFFVVDAAISINEIVPNIVKRVSWVKSSLLLRIHNKHTNKY